jgi:hypothetical protein
MVGQQRGRKLNVPQFFLFEGLILFISAVVFIVVAILLTLLPLNIISLTVPWLS